MHEQFIPHSIPHTTPPSTTYVHPIIQPHKKRQVLPSPQMEQIPQRPVPTMGRRMRTNRQLRPRMAPQHWRKHGTTHHQWKWVPTPLQHIDAVGGK